METFMFVLMVCGQYTGKPCTPVYFRTAAACEYALHNLKPWNRNASFCAPLGIKEPRNAKIPA